jgi:hypothetical protein
VASFGADPDLNHPGIITARFLILALRKQKDSELKGRNVLYLPLYYTVSTLAYREGLLSNKVGLISFVIAGVFHAAEVGHNVFKAW